jgi:metal-dependent hydrolase (beta-lactamase superfamily II)
MSAQSPPSIEERLEHGEIIASQKGEQAAGQSVFGDIEMEIVVEPGRIEEEVDRYPFEHEPALTVDREGGSVIIRSGDRRG